MVPLRDGKSRCGYCGEIAYGIAAYTPLKTYLIPVSLLGAFAVILLFVSTVRFDPFNALSLVIETHMGSRTAESYHRRYKWAVESPAATSWRRETTRVRGREEPVEVVEVPAVFASHRLPH